MSDDGELLHLVANHARLDGDPSRRKDEAKSLGHAFDIAKGQRHASSLKFRYKDGSSFIMPYAYHPILWGYQADTLLIEYPGFFTVRLTGKDPGALEDRIANAQVLWIRECDQAMAASLPIAITQIEILHAYPSRENAVDPGKKTGE